MKHLIGDQREVIASWVAKHVGMQGHWGQYYAIGVYDDVRKEIVAGVVFNQANRSNVLVHIAMTKHVGRAMVKLFESVSDYAFNQMKYKRMTGTVPVSDTHTLKFDQHLGFEIEHIVKDGADDGDLALLVMWPHTCRWLNGEKNGTELKNAA